MEPNNEQLAELLLKCRPTIEEFITTLFEKGRELGVYQGDARMRSIDTEKQVIQQLNSFTEGLDVGRFFAANAPIWIELLLKNMMQAHKNAEDGDADTEATS